MCLVKLYWFALKSQLRSGQAEGKHEKIAGLARLAEKGIFAHAKTRPFELCKKG